MRALATGIAVLAVLGLGGCTEVEDAAVEGYEPAHLEEIEGSGIKQITFTQEGADRTGLKTATVRRDGARLVFPYSALVYDAGGKSWVYAVQEPRTYMRAEVEVDRIAGDRVLAREGPPPGAKVVTVGSTEVYGTELEIAGGH